MFSLEPSIAQARLVRDLHADFERANQAALARGWIVPERMVFPQRALVEERAVGHTHTHLIVKTVIIFVRRSTSAADGIPYNASKVHA